MKATPLIFILLFQLCSQANAQAGTGDQAISGSYRFNIDCFPLLRFDIYQNRSVIYFDSMGQRGLLTPTASKVFHFSSADYEGSVRFVREDDATEHMFVTVGGRTYEGVKKIFPVNKPFQLRQENVRPSLTSVPFIH